MDISYGRATTRVTDTRRDSGMRRFEQIKSGKKTREEKPCDRVDITPETNRCIELIRETSALVRAIDQCLAA
jgi:hypothetical protein